MLSARFESKLGFKIPKSPPPRMQYTLTDAQADARLLLAQTEDRAYTLGRLEPLLHDQDSSLHEAVRAHYEHLEMLSLGSSYSVQILGPFAAADTGMASSSSIATTTTHADAVRLIGGGVGAWRGALPLNITLPAAAPSHTQHSSDSSSSAPLSVAALKQLTKDLERDRLIINGRFVVGAEAGMRGIHAMVRTYVHCWNRYILHAM